MHRLLTLILPIILIAAASSCRGSDEFSRFVDIGGSAWGYSDTLDILVTDLDSIPAKRLSVAVVHNDEFPYRNLWIEVSYRDSIGRLYRDSVSVEMADEFGRWLGKSIGGSHQCETSLAHAFPLRDSTRISLRHIMRGDTIRGIDKIGLTVSHLP